MVAQITLSRTALKVSLWLMLACQAGDLISTFIGLSKGIPEANPFLLLIANYLGIYSAVILTKASLMVVCIWSYRQIGKIPSPSLCHGLTVIFFFTSYIYLLTIARNLAICEFQG